MFIDDMRKDDRFKCSSHLGKLSNFIFETKMHVVFLLFGLHDSQIDIALTDGNGKC
jgi:hypothetical protein